MASVSLRTGLISLLILAAGLLPAADTPAPAPAPTPSPAPDPAKAPERSIQNSLGMVLQLIPAGTFRIGSPDAEKDRESQEGPAHEATIKQAFYLGATEVTQGQWKALMGQNTSHFQGDDLPVESVSRPDCEAFLKKLSEKEGKTCRLPTEAEWEYACRAGSTGRFCFGDDETKLGAYAWMGANSEQKTHPVGAKLPNAWGLYDMHGNVWEWCRDGYQPYKDEPVSDPAGANDGENALFRGGHWAAGAPLCRSAFRNWALPEHLDNSGGFRVLLEAPPQKP